MNDMICLSPAKLLAVLALAMIAASSVTVLVLRLTAARALAIPTQHRATMERGRAAHAEPCIRLEAALWRCVRLQESWASPGFKVWLQFNGRGAELLVGDGCNPDQAQEDARPRIAEFARRLAGALAEEERPGTAPEGGKGGAA